MGNSRALVLGAHPVARGAAGRRLPHPARRAAQPVGLQRPVRLHGRARVVHRRLRALHRHDEAELRRHRHLAAAGTCNPASSAIPARTTASPTTTPSASPPSRAPTSSARPSCAWIPTRSTSSTSACTTRPSRSSTGSRRTRAAPAGAATDPERAGRLPDPGHPLALRQLRRLHRLEVERRVARHRRWPGPGPHHGHRPLRPVPHPGSVTAPTHVEMKTMVSRYYRAYAAVTALAGASALWGGTACVQQRPSRNGVFNENQYLRKDFLIASGDGSSQDTGWFVKSTIVSTSTPNPLAYAGGAGLYAGAEGGFGANYIRFQVTQDKLQMINLREISNDPTNNAQGLSTPEISNAWPITNVDLKYQINLDGEKSNFYQENQELDWQVRQWVKVNFAKNDLSDLYAFGANTSPVIQNCTDLADASRRRWSPDSFNGRHREQHVPVLAQHDGADRLQGDRRRDLRRGVRRAADVPNLFAEMGRQNVSTSSSRRSFVRPEKVVDGTYVPMPIAEKDPIQHKYGAFQTVVPYRDPTTGLLSAQQLVNRFDPNKPMVWYFAPGMPDVYKDFFVNTVQATATQTNDRPGEEPAPRAAHVPQLQRRQGLQGRRRPGASVRRPALQLHQLALGSGQRLGPPRHRAVLHRSAHGRDDLGVGQPLRGAVQGHGAAAPRSVPPDGGRRVPPPERRVRRQQVPADLHGRRHGADRPARRGHPAQPGVDRLLQDAGLPAEALRAVRIPRPRRLPPDARQ